VEDLERSGRLPAAAAGLEGSDAHPAYPAKNNLTGRPPGDRTGGLRKEGRCGRFAFRLSYAFATHLRPLRGHQVLRTLRGPVVRERGWRVRRYYVERSSSAHPAIEQSARSNRAFTLHLISQDREPGFP